MHHDTKANVDRKKSSLSGAVASTVIMMTSSNGNIFRVIGPLCGEFTGPGGFPAQRPVTRGFDDFFDLRQQTIKLVIWDANRGHYGIIVMYVLIFCVIRGICFDLDSTQIFWHHSFYDFE